APLHEGVGPLGGRGSVHNGEHPHRTADVHARGFALIGPTPLRAVAAVEPKITDVPLLDSLEPLFGLGTVHNGDHPHRTADAHACLFALIGPTPFRAAPPTRRSTDLAPLHEGVGPLGGRGTVHDGEHPHRTADAHARGFALIGPTQLRAG